MKAILWGYKYNDMKLTWQAQTLWVVRALQKLGIEVVKHKNFICEGTENLPIYDFKKDNCDICIYNHADISHLRGNIIKTKENWFFKPTVPDECHTTLDKLGYGPYSSISYTKPNFEETTLSEVNDFYNTKVNYWINKKTTKWGTWFKERQLKEVEVKDKDYYLVISQCLGDEVVTRHSFGEYLTSLKAIIKELSVIDNRTIIVKLHPDTDGAGVKTTTFSEKIKKQIESIGPKIKVILGRYNIHNFIKNSRCVILANSGAGFEAMMHDKPIISFGYPEYHWVTYDLRHLADLERAIKLDWFNATKQRKFLYWYMENYCFYDQKTCNRRVEEMINETKR